MAFNWGDYLPTVIELEDMPKDCIVMLQPPGRFHFKVDPSADQMQELGRELFEYLMQCRPVVIKNIGGNDGV